MRAGLPSVAHQPASSASGRTAGSGSARTVSAQVANAGQDEDSGAAAETHEPQREGLGHGYRHPHDRGCHNPLEPGRDDGRDDSQRGLGEREYRQAERHVVHQAVHRAHSSGGPLPLSSRLAGATGQRIEPPELLSRPL